MTDRDEQLPAELARRNWKIWGGLVLISLCWRSVQVTLGVFLGGLLAVGAFYWLKLSLVRLLISPAEIAPRRYQFGYIIRLATLAALILVLIAVVKVHPVALAAGLSVVVLNIFWTTLLRLKAARRPDIP